MDLLLIKMAMHTAVYFIWRERNERWHGAGHHPYIHLIAVIDRTIHHHITALCYQDKDKYEALQDRWCRARQ
ncbi:hypothetical protein V5N11_012473 [Cardamine amara subsp. amara]|uniref:Uncharacterized protein n=1 Tax=Cardamine amara subsp. amara TaxID=228776 RepID=A0ABD0Z586_CARAN